ncbi:MAG: helix-turn-helix transcriptional regulator [Candidatus Phlomobacter fragariae]
MNVSEVLTNHLISFMVKQKEAWGIQDTESRFIYTNKVFLKDSCLTTNFNIEGRYTFECPVSWAEYADIFDNHKKIVIESGKKMVSIATHPVAKEQTLQSFFVEKSPYYNQNKIIGTISHGRKIPPVLLSKYFFKNPTIPSLLTNHPPNDLFTTEELNVLFFAMKLFGDKEIALRLGTYSCVVEQIIRQICNKIGIHSRKQLRDYGIAEGFDNYFPPFLLKGLL